MTGTDALPDTSSLTTEVRYNSIISVLTDTFVSSLPQLFITNVENRLLPMSIIKTGLRNSDVYGRNLLIRLISTRHPSAIKKKNIKNYMFFSDSKVSTDSCC